MFTRLLGNDKIKFDEDDPNAKPVQVAWNELLKEFSDGFRAIIKKIATKRDSMSMADAMKQAIDEVTEKILVKYKKYLETLWQYNKVTYQGKAK
jgi:predicted component of type VI protein secretion system